MAPASHVITLDGNSGFAIEANMLHGVRRVTVEEAIRGAVVVSTVDYEVPDAEAGLVWLRATAERNADYDFKGAFGVALAPDRNWQEDSDWFCSELHANGMVKAGRRTFVDNARVTPYNLMCIEPRLLL
jgi:hypothetical protein